MTTKTNTQDLRLAPPAQAQLTLKSGPSLEPPTDAKQVPALEKGPPAVCRNSGKGAPVQPEPEPAKPIGVADDIAAKVREADKQFDAQATARARKRRKQELHIEDLKRLVVQLDWEHIVLFEKWFIYYENIRAIGANSKLFIADAD